MTSNEHGAIEQNVEHHEANNLTYYTRESELHARSYALSNMSICCNKSRTWRKKSGTGEVNAYSGSQIRSARARGRSSSATGGGEAGGRSRSGGVTFSGFGGNSCGSSVANLQPSYTEAGQRYMRLSSPWIARPKVHDISPCPCTEALQKSYTFF